VSERIVLTARHTIAEAIDLEECAPDRLARLPEAAIAQLPVWRGRDRLKLGDLFNVHGGHSSTVVVEGAGPRVHGLGAAMLGGRLVIDGDAGDFVGAGMTGGAIEARGSVGDDAGVGMSGGTLDVIGNCGDRAGAARPGSSRGMTGGEIVVRGRAGGSVGACCRRGLIIVLGDAGEAVARGMIAGSVFVFGRVGAGAAQFNKRGSLVVLGEIDVPQTYRYACEYRPPHIRVTLLYLARRYGIGVESRHVAGRYRRYCGDPVPPGKGEILVWLDADRYTAQL
jgi:formylmethanofuran dehydrogenase subunit C